MKIFRGRKSVVGCIVELTDEGYTTQLSLEKSLQVVDHAPDGFQWGYNGSRPAQLSAAILYEVTGNADLARQYYQISKHDFVAQWQDTFEIDEHQVLAWISTIGALQVNVVDTAKIEFEAFNRLYLKTDRRWRRASASGHQVLEAIPPCENAISLSHDWVQKYKPHIQKLRPATGEAFEWMPMIQEIRNRLRQFRTLLSYQQADRPLLETADKIREEVEELLENHCYLPEV